MPASDLKGPQGAVQPSDPQESSRRKRSTILIIEDENDISTFLTLRLAHAGYRVVVTRKGSEGLRAAMDLRPSAVILDLMLPELSGEAVCMRLKDSYDEKLARIPVVILTAKAGDTDRLVGRAMGADAYLTKPFEFQDLLGVIEKLISPEPESGDFGTLAGP